MSGSGAAFLVSHLGFCGANPKLGFVAKTTTFDKLVRSPSTARFLVASCCSSTKAAAIALLFAAARVMGAHFSATVVEAIADLMMWQRERAVFEVRLERSVMGDL